VKDIEKPGGLEQPNSVQWKSDVAAEMLRRLGIPYIALNPGASYRGFHDSLVNYLGNDAPQMLLCLHEDHAVSIAHGYAKATGKAMACALHSNVGLMHGLMGIYNAWCDRAPMIAIGATGPVVSDIRRPWIDWIHTSKDQGALLRDYTKWDDEPRSAQGVVEAFLRGVQMTEAQPKAPVYICLDAGLQEERITKEVRFPDVGRYKAPAAPGAPPEIAADILRRIREAKRPVFLFGRGGLSAPEWKSRIALAEAAGATVFTSRRERSIFPTDHPLHIQPPLGPLGEAGKAALSSADLTVSFDWVDLDSLIRQIDPDLARVSAEIVHVSLDSILHNGWSMDHFGVVPADMPVMADPDVVVAQLLSQWPEDQGKPAPAGAASTPLPPYSERAATEIAPLDIEIALAETRGGRDDFTLTQVNLGWTASVYAYRHPLDFLGHNGGGGLGAGTGITVGAALALKEEKRIVIGVLGDGDFLQGNTALWTAAHYGIPALFLIVNNRSNFNDERHQESVAKERARPVENRWIGLRIDEPAIDLSAMARAQGVEAEGPVESVPALLEALKRGVKAVEEGHPYLIDARVVPGYASVGMGRGH